MKGHLDGVEAVAICRRFIGVAMPWACWSCIGCLLQDETVAVRGSFTGTLKNGDTAKARFVDFFTPAEDGRFATRETFFFAPLV